jgi:pyroglutamyl-peptidase
MTTILVTGFGRFPGAAVNPTTALATRVARAGRRRGIHCVAHVFATRYAAVDRELPKLIAAHVPDAILMFGVAGRRRNVCIETFARNRMSTWFPDAGGVLPARGPIVLGAATRMRGRAPFTRLLAAARATGVTTILSRDPGTYLCNYIYWRAIEATAQADGPRRVVFVHVPPLGRAFRRRGTHKRRAFTLDQLARVGEAVWMAVSRG